MSKDQRSEICVSCGEWFHPTKSGNLCMKCRGGRRIFRTDDEFIQHVKTKGNERIKNDPRYKRPHAGLNGDAHRIVLNDGEVVTL